MSVGYTPPGLVGQDPAGSLEIAVKQRRMSRLMLAAMVTAGVLATAGAAAAIHQGVTIRDGNLPSSAALSCPGGMVRLGQIFSEGVPAYPGDPAPEIDTLFDYDPDGFLLETVFTGTHTGTHLSAPRILLRGCRQSTIWTPRTSSGRPT